MMFRQPRFKSVPVLALGRVGSLPRASGLRGPHGSKKGAYQAVDCAVYKIQYVVCYSYAYNYIHTSFIACMNNTNLLFSVPFVAANRRSLPIHSVSRSAYSCGSKSV